MIAFGVCFFEIPVDAYEKSLKNVKVVIDAGHAENKRVCICGELAADTALTEEFLKM